MREHTVEIVELNFYEAEDFFRSIIQPQEQVSFTSKGKFYGYKLNNSIVGMISTLPIGKTTRIKSLIVKREFRANGIGLELLKFVLIKTGRYSAFATKYSRRLFSRMGFVATSEPNKNNVVYMVKEK